MNTKTMHLFAQRETERQHDVHSFGFVVFCISKPLIFLLMFYPPDILKLTELGGGDGDDDIVCVSLVVFLL
jgi:hypothetical protein